MTDEYREGMAHLRAYSHWLRRRGFFHRGQTIFTEEEFAKITAYLKKKGLRMYTFLKRASLEFIERHP